MIKEVPQIGTEFHVVVPQEDFTVSHILRDHGVVFHRGESDSPKPDGLKMYVGIVGSKDLSSIVDSIMYHTPHTSNNWSIGQGLASNMKELIADNSSPNEYYPGITVGEFIAPERFTFYDLDDSVQDDSIKLSPMSQS